MVVWAIFPCSSAFRLLPPFLFVCFVYFVVSVLGGHFSEQRGSHYLIWKEKRRSPNKSMRFSWSTTCRSDFAMPRASFFRNRSFLPRNAMLSTPLVIVWSNDKHCCKNTPTMKTDAVIIQIYYRHWTKIIPAVSPGPAKSSQVLSHHALQHRGALSRGPTRCGPSSRSFPFSLLASPVLGRGRAPCTHGRGEGSSPLFPASSLIPHPSSLIPHPSSLIPHPSSFAL